MKVMKIMKNNIPTQKEFIAEHIKAVVDQMVFRIATTYNIDNFPLLKDLSQFEVYFLKLHEEIFISHDMLQQQLLKTIMHNIHPIYHVGVTSPLSKPPKWLRLIKLIFKIVRGKR